MDRLTCTTLGTLALMLTLAGVSFGLPTGAVAADGGDTGTQVSSKTDKDDKDKEKKKDRLASDAGPSSSGVARGDFNNDGFGDLAVGVPFEGIDTFVQCGAVNVIYGTAGGLRSAGNQFWHQGVSGVPGGNETGDQFGRSLASGDFNGDGFSDLAIGAPFEDVSTRVDEGSVTILFGSAGGLSSVGAQGLTGAAAGDRFGWSLAWGDFDNDNVGDLAVGAPRADDADSEDEGEVRIYRGILAEGLRFQSTLDQNSFRIGSIEGSLETSFDRFGETLAAGDFDGGGHSDLAIGVPHKGLSNAGMVYVVFGSVDVLDPLANPAGERVAQFRLNDEVAESGDLFGASLAAGDFRRSAGGFQCLAVGIPGEDLGSGNGPFEGTSARDTGKVVVFFGAGRGFAGVQELSQDLAGIPMTDESGDAFGSSLAAGDFNGDRCADLAIGIPLEDVSTGGTTSVDAGAVIVLYGQPGSSFDPFDSQVWHQNQGWGSSTANLSDRFGLSLTAWNFGNGTQADLVIAVPGEDILGLPDAGMVHVLYGSGTGLTTAGSQFWNQFFVQGNLEAFDNFGLALY